MLLPRYFPINECKIILEKLDEFNDKNYHKKTEYKQNEFNSLIVEPTIQSKTEDTSLQNLLDH